MFEELKEMIKEIMPEVNTENVTLDTKLVEDLAFDSLAIMMLSINIEDKFHITFTEQVKFVTVGDVVKYVEEHTK